MLFIDGRLNVHTDYLLNADFNFSSIISGNWCITGSRLTDMVCHTIAYSCLKRKAARNGGISDGHGSSPKSPILVLLSKKHTHIPNLWTKSKGLFAPNFTK